MTILWCNYSYNIITIMLLLFLLLFFLFLVGQKFDIVCSLEVIEHVETPFAFLSACNSCLKDGGSMYLSTINRNLKSFSVAIVGAEYVLGMLPPGGF